MAYTTIDNPELYFQTKLFSGTGGGGGSLTFDGSEDMQPDWVWSKSRTEALNHTLFDSVRGAGSNKELTSNNTAPEGGADSAGFGYISAFNSDGFTWTAGGTNTENFNKSSQTYVHWNWKASGSTASNTDGSITSTVSANTTAGFSIASFTASSGGTVDTIGHGLGVAPSMIICKSTTNTDNWFVYHNSLGATKRTMLNLTNATDTNTIWGDTNPSSTVFSLNVVNNFGQGRGGIAYCFAEKKGYSKFGSYKGNGNADGSYIHLGFRPAWIMIKKSSGTENWSIFDTKRNVNGTTNTLPINADQNYAESGNTGKNMDILSNGVKMKTSNGELNGSGATYIYMAFAEQPFVNSNGVPNNAR